MLQSLDPPAMNTRTALTVISVVYLAQAIGIFLGAGTIASGAFPGIAESELALSVGTLMHEALAGIAFCTGMVMWFARNLESGAASFADSQSVPWASLAWPVTTWPPPTWSANSAPRDDTRPCGLRGDRLSGRFCRTWPPPPSFLSQKPRAIRGFFCA